MITDPLVYALTQASCQVTVADNGRDGLALARELIARLKALLRRFELDRRQQTAVPLDPPCSCPEGKPTRQHQKLTNFALRLLQEIEYLVLPKATASQSPK